MIKYKIVEIHESEHSIVVRYYTDKITEEMLATDILEGVIRRGRTDYNINLPIPAPTGEELHIFICQHAPRTWLFAQEDILNPDIDTSLSNIKSLINLEVVIKNDHM